MKSLPILTQVAGELVTHTRQRRHFRSESSLAYNDGAVAACVNILRVTLRHCSVMDQKLVGYTIRVGLNIDRRIV